MHKKNLSSLSLIISLLLVVVARNDLLVLAENEQIRQHCGGSLTEEQYQELLDLSDITTFGTYQDAPFRTRRIADVFAEAGDRRGIFASMYVTITDESTRSTLAGEYENQELAEQLVYVFAKRYLDPLHKYLLGVETEAKWGRYFDLAMDCGNSNLYVLGTGVNTHLTYDLPLTLLEIGATDGFEDDFMYFGELLVEKTEESTDLLFEQQGVDASDFFNGFFVGDGIDSIAGEQTTARFIFQYVRGGAWKDFTLLRDYRRGSWIARSLDRRWWARQQLLRLLP